MAQATTVASRETRRLEIDREAAKSLATNPAFVSSLNLPPIPPSTPPLQRKEIENNRRELIGQLVLAAAAGNETEYRRIMGQLNPNASELTIASTYGTTRLAFLEKRRELLEKECVSSTVGTDRAATEYWMRQLAHTVQEISNMRGGGLPILELEIALGRMADMIPGKPGTAEYNRRLEALLSGAIDAGYPARTVFALAWDKSGDPNGQMAARLCERAITRARTLFYECTTLYGQQDTSDSARIDYQRKYNEFRIMCGGLLPVDGEGHFDQTIFSRPAGFTQFVDDLELHFRISARNVTNP